MPVGGPGLVLLTLASIALLLVLILVVKLHAFLALLISSMALGLAAGMVPAAVLKSIQSGFGEALGFIAVVVGLGAMIGRFIEDSGGGRALADCLIARFGRDRVAWALVASAYLVGLPIFFEVGFIILAPLVWSLARESKRSLLFFGMPVIAALSATHSLVPPHPAPSAAAQLLGADLGRVILYGIAVSLPMAILGGIIYGGWIAKRMFIPVPAMATRPEVARPAGQTDAPPPVALVALILLLPVLLIFAASIMSAANWPGKSMAAFFGHPFTALLVATLVAMFALGARRGPQCRQQQHWTWGDPDEASLALWPAPLGRHSAPRAAGRRLRADAARQRRDAEHPELFRHHRQHARHRRQGEGLLREVQLQM